MCPTLGDWAYRKAGFPPATLWFHRRWESQWSYDAVTEQLTVWAPPPEIAAQLIHFLLSVYVEAPLSTAALILIPRILQRRWSGMSNVIVEVGTYQRTEAPILCHTNLTIPIVVLLIPCNVRVLPSIHRLDTPTSTADQRIHEAAKTRLHGMLESLDSR
jgi:hypothetical protein